MKTLVLIVVKVSEVRDNRFIEKPVFSSSGLVFEDPVVSVGQCKKALSDRFRRSGLTTQKPKSEWKEKIKPRIKWGYEVLEVYFFVSL